MQKLANIQKIVEFTFMWMITSLSDFGIGQTIIFFC